MKLIGAILLWAAVGWILSQVARPSKSVPWWITVILVWSWVACGGSLMYWAASVLEIKQSKPCDPPARIQCNEVQHVWGTNSRICTCRLTVAPQTAKSVP